MASKADWMRILRPGSRLLLGICLAAMPTAAMAANNCAWINDATASGLLGGDAAADVTAPAAAGEPTVCTFTQMSAGVKRTLRIAVEISTDAHARVGAIAQSCGSGAFPLKAIGNEAVACPVDSKKEGLSERAVGRVRDQVFTITIGSTQNNDPILTREALKARIYTAAEQVAGNLF